MYVENHGFLPPQVMYTVHTIVPDEARKSYGNKN